MEHAQKIILVFIREITSGAQRVLLWRNERDMLTVNSQQIRSEMRKKTIHLPTEFIRVLVIISMKINQKKTKLPLGIIQCLWETEDC